MLRNNFFILWRLLDLPDVNVLAQVRHEALLPRSISQCPRLTIIVADLREVDAIAPYLADVDAAVLLATSWGGADTMAITCDANLALADLLIAAGCQHILYFATARDRYCMMHPTQCYDVPVNPAFFGLPVLMRNITEGFTLIGLPK